MNVRIVLVASGVWCSLFCVAVSFGQDAAGKRIKRPLKGSAVAHINDSPSLKPSAASSLSREQVQPLLSGQISGSGVLIQLDAGDVAPGSAAIRASEDEARQTAASPLASPSASRALTKTAAPTLAAGSTQGRSLLAQPPAPANVDRTPVAPRAPLPQLKKTLKVR